MDDFTLCLNSKDSLTIQEHRILEDEKLLYAAIDVDSVSRKVIPTFGLFLQLAFKRVSLDNRTYVLYNFR